MVLVYLLVVILFILPRGELKRQLISYLRQADGKRPKEGLKYPPIFEALAA